MTHKFCKSQLFCPDRYQANEDRMFTHIRVASDRYLSDKLSATVSAARAGAVQWSDTNSMERGAVTAGGRDETDHTVLYRAVQGQAALM